MVDAHGRYIIPCRGLSYTYLMYVCDGSRMGLIYFIRGLSALSFLYDLRQCEGLDT